MNGPSKLSERQRAALDYAARTLLCAGNALSQPQETEADRRLARLLLSECCVACGVALTDDPSLTKPDASVAALAAAGFAPQGLARVPEILRPEHTPSAHDLREVEALAADLVKAAAGERNPRVLANLVVAGLCALIVLGIAGSSFVPRPPYESYIFRASSTEDGFRKFGKLGHHGISDLIFHTREEEKPWVLIDMLKKRTLSEIVLVNRADCCPERGLPLLVELGLDRTKYETIGRRSEVFDKWTLKFPERSARYVRLRAESKTVLQLRGIQIR